MQLSGSGFKNILIVLIDRFGTARQLVREIFVDETLLKIDGQDYWLWIAYEPNLKTCLMMHLSREGRFLCVINSSDSSGIDMAAENPYSQMVLDGTIMLVNDSG